jgi:hypothetical protein
VHQLRAVTREKQMVRIAPPNLSLNPDASPAALARRSLGAGLLCSLGRR